MKLIAWLKDLSNEDVDIAGGKGASLGEMWNAGLPVPPAFVVTADAYKYFIKETKLNEKIKEVLKGLDVNNNDELTKKSAEVRELIENVKMPKDLELAIIESYNQLGENTKTEEPFVAVRSSATAEDLPDASFAGQQDTYLNMKGADEVVNAVQRCFASLFTPRAVFYREQKGFDHFDVALAAVVQKMVNADKAGVLFTVNPINHNYDEMVIEGAWGLGEGVVSGTVSPDTYIVGKDGKIKDVYVATKETMFVKDEDGITKEIATPEDLKNKRVLSDDELLKLLDKGLVIEKHYNRPMDIEWAIENDEVYMLQARPITTLDDKSKSKISKSDEKEGGNIILKGIGASPGTESGVVKILEKIEEIDKINEGDILVTKMTTPDMVPAMKKASAIVTNDGGLTCHAAIISRELGTPCVVGTKKATEVLKEGDVITVDGEKGTIYEGIIKKEEQSENTQSVVYQGAPLITATEIKVNVSMPEVAERAAATNADGVGLLRAEHMILGTGVHPLKVLEEEGEEGLVNVFADGIRVVADAFYPKSVTYRTLDAPTDEFRGLEGGDDEPMEHNPMLGWRGIRRGLDQPEILKCELLAVKKLIEEGYKNIMVMIPLVSTADEVKKVKKLGEEIGLRLGKDVEFGVMVETPAAALIIEDIIDAGIDFVSLGTNDLTQYTIAIDRNNEYVAKYYRENHPAVLKLIEYVLKTCKKKGVKTSICGQAGSRPAIVEKLVEWGITSISSNIDAIDTIRQTVARTEQRIILDIIRDSKNRSGL